MGLALGTAAVVLVVLLWELARPSVMKVLSGARAAWERRGHVSPSGYDPGRERRAEQRARELLRSCVSELEWEMYRDLGLLRVQGPVRPAAAGFSPLAGEHAALGGKGAAQRASGGEEQDLQPPYAYLIYPHKPIVAYVPGDAASC